MLQTLALSLRAKEDEGEPLPTVFHQLADLGAHFRRGWLHLIAAAPGGGKSALSAFLVQQLRLPALYFSADNDKLTFGVNAVAMACGVHTNTAEEMLRRGDRVAYAALEEATEHMWVSFQSAPSPQDFREEVDAFAAVYGEYPQVVVIDNLVDVDGSSGGFGSGWEEQDAILSFLKGLAEEIQCAMIVLAHLTGQYTDGQEPTPRSALINKIDKRPQLILTMFNDSETSLGVSVVKNRRGRAQADGSLWVSIPWLREMAWFGTGQRDSTQEWG